MVAKRRPYDTQGLGEFLKMLKLNQQVGYFHSFPNVIPIVVTMLKFWSRRENHWHRTSGLIWQASYVAMHWWAVTTMENLLTLMVSAKLLLLSTITERCPGKFCYWKSLGNISFWWVTRPRCPPTGAVSTTKPASLWTNKQLKLPKLKSHIRKETC